jgi:DNA-binding GntR family transcriptional regulator
MLEISTAKADTSPMSTAHDAVPYAFLSPLSRGQRGRTMQLVQEVLRDAIVTLALVPGEFIDKEALCRRLGVSRFPVSEALGRLADEGLVEVLPQRGTRVNRIDIAACRQASFIRRALEVEAIGAIAPRIDDGFIAGIENNLLEQKLAVEKTDALLFFQHDAAFHQMLLDELGYDRVKLAVEAARGSLDRVRHLLLRTPQRQAQSYEEHVAILEALKNRDAQAARRAMRQHLDNALADIEARAAKNPEIFAMDAFTPGSEPHCQRGRMPAEQEIANG